MMIAEQEQVDARTADAAAARYPVRKWSNGRMYELDDCVAEEVAVALIYNGISHAVMLATPQDLEEFALGFSLTEGIITQPGEIYGMDIVPRSNGIEVNLEISAERFQSLKAMRRSMAGRTGCGLCGAESLDMAIRPTRTLHNLPLQVQSEAIHRACLAIRSQQKLQTLTGATHACAWANPHGKIQYLREDVGRHNALDKLIGARARQAEQDIGFALTTSRASYEMVQKAASAGIPMLIAISAPTGLAIRIAQDCGITLVGFARDDQHVVYSHAHRITYKGQQ